MDERTEDGDERMINIDVAWKSLNKYEEELCGDKVEVLYTKDSVVLILADGMGSGVKANILATLTSKILRTMFREGASIELAVETIAKTLPICRERKVAYSTFSILQVNYDGNAYLAEFDNPGCIFVRKKKLQNYPCKERILEGKVIREYRFQAEAGDCFVLMSDGAVWAGTGEIMNYNWTWEDLAEYTLKCVRETRSAARMAALLSDACNDLYGNHPGDDTTVAIMRVEERKTVNILTGPPGRMEDDETVIQDFMKTRGIKVVAGGTTSDIAARVLRKTIQINGDGTAVIPPTSHIDGMDLVVEGVITLSRVLAFMRQYAKGDLSVEFFAELDADNGASRLARLLIEECTDIHLFVGTAINQAYEDRELPFEFSARRNLIVDLKKTAESIGKKVVVEYK